MASSLSVIGFQASKRAREAGVTEPDAVSWADLVGDHGRVPFVRGILDSSAAAVAAARPPPTCRNLRLRLGSFRFGGSESRCRPASVVGRSRCGFVSSARTARPWATPCSLAGRGPRVRPITSSRPPRAASNGNSGSEPPPGRRCSTPPTRWGRATRSSSTPAPTPGSSSRPPAPPSARITFRTGAGRDRRPSTRTVPAAIDGINLEGASYVTVQGFNVADRTRTGIRAVLCDHVTIRGNVLEDNGTWGVLTGCCDDLVIEGNYAAGSVDEHGIYVSNSGDRPLIRGNVIVGNDDNGIHMNGDLSIPCDGSTPQDGVISFAVVEGNTIVDNGAGDGGSGINCDGVQDSIIRNNLIHSTHASGISLYRDDGGAPSHRNTGRWAIPCWWPPTAAGRSTSRTARPRPRCATTSSGAQQGLPRRDGRLRRAASPDSPAIATWSRTASPSTAATRVLTLAQWRTATGQDLQSVVDRRRRPRWLRCLSMQASGDYHLATGSAALDAGEALAGPAFRPRAIAASSGPRLGRRRLRGHGRDLRRWRRRRVSGTLDGAAALARNAE